MIKHFTWILLGMTAMAQAMDDPKDDDKVVFTQTPAQALVHKALVEAIENQPDPGPTRYKEGRGLYYLEDTEDVAGPSESPKATPPDKPNSSTIYYDEDDDLCSFLTKDSNTPEDFPKAFESSNTAALDKPDSSPMHFSNGRDSFHFHPEDSDTPGDFPKAFEPSLTEAESTKASAATESTTSDVKRAAEPAPAANPKTESDDDDDTTETPQDTVQWLYDHRLGKSYYLSDDFIVIEDAAEPSKPTNTAVATESKTSDVKPIEEPAPVFTPQTTSHNKKSYFPELQCDPVRGVWYISLIPEKSPRKPQTTTKPQTSDVKSTVNPKTASNDDNKE